MAERSQARSPARRERRWLLLLVVLVPGLPPWATASDGPVRNQKISTPREFGYVIGDRVRQRIQFELARDHRLNSASLPKPARLSRWLSLVEVDVDVGGSLWGARPHVVTLDYQVVNAPRAALRVGVPPQALEVLGPRDSFPIVLPAWGFAISPIVSSSDRTVGQMPDLRPAHLPPPFDTRARIARLATGVALGLMALGVLCYLHLRLPFLARTRRPFARACTQIRGLRRAARDESALTAALGEAHRAFNRTAGYTVFAHDLERFFREHRTFEPLRGEIEMMFAASQHAFYRTGAPAPGSFNPASVLALCVACRNRERGLP